MLVHRTVATHLLEVDTMDYNVDLENELNSVKGYSDKKDYVIGAITAILETEFGLADLLEVHNYVSYLADTSIALDEDEVL